MISTQYLFMFPLCIVLATSCQIAGIGGAAILGPIFLLVFPLLGPSYPLANAQQAVATSLLNEVFGFASGFIGYSLRGLIDWKICKSYITYSIPISFVGAILAKFVLGNVFCLRIIYAALMIGLSMFLIFSPRPEEIDRNAKEVTGEEYANMPEENPSAQKEEKLMPLEVVTSHETVRNHRAADGSVFTYLDKPISIQGIGYTFGGAALTGLLGVGIGEVVLLQLMREKLMPLPVAAGTSVAIVVATAMTAAMVQFISLSYTMENGTILNVIPWDLVVYSVPGVLIGGQLAPFIASKRPFTDEQIEKYVAFLFGTVGLAFVVKAVIGEEIE